MQTEACLDTSEEDQRSGVVRSCAYSKGMGVYWNAEDP